MQNKSATTLASCLLLGTLFLFSETRPQEKRARFVISETADPPDVPVVVHAAAMVSNTKALAANQPAIRRALPAAPPDTVWEQRFPSYTEDSENDDITNQIPPARGL